MNRADIIAEARTWLNTPFHHQGRSTAGIDCAGLIIKVAHGLGLSDFDYTAYAPTPDGVTMKALLDEHMQRISPRVAQPGDVLLMRFRKDPQHLAILTDKGMIHAHRSVDKVVETGINEKWKGLIIGAYRYPGIDSEGDA